MSIVVRKSPAVVVRPWEVEVPTLGSIKLCSWDKIGAASFATGLLVFDRPVVTHEPAAETIKRCLSQALVHYYPFAGRLAVGEDGMIIKCSGEGVSFVSATTNGVLGDIMFKDTHDYQPLLKELAVHHHPAADGNITAHPLLMMQVTEFSCGGYVVAVTWSHAVADGAGMGQFLQALGELVRGLPTPSVVPVRCWDDKLPGIPPSNMHDLMQVTKGMEPYEYALLDVTVPWSVISSIKNTYSSSSSRTCTMFEAVAAVLWQCRTRAIISDPDAPSALFFSVNARGYLGVADGYYGNCGTSQLVVAASGAVADRDITEIVKMIQDAKDQIPAQFNHQDNIFNVVNMIKRYREEFSSDQLPQFSRSLGYNACFVTSWRNLGIDEVDLGRGRPARVVPYREPRPSVPFCIPCPPCTGKDGCNVLTIFLKQEHVDGFLAQLGSLSACPS